jgi:hypothetical protein
MNESQAAREQGTLVVIVQKPKVIARIRQQIYVSQLSDSFQAKPF